MRSIRVGKGEHVMPVSLVRNIGLLYLSADRPPGPGSRTAGPAAAPGRSEPTARNTSGAAATDIDPDDVDPAALGAAWVRRRGEQPAKHACKPPAPDGDPGDLWRCYCGKLWRIGDRCDSCDHGGTRMHGGQCTVGEQWRPARLWQRMRHWRAAP